MIKKIAIGIFVVVFTIFALDYFKLMPDNQSLLLHHVSTRQLQEIENFTVNEKQQAKSEKFTDRVYQESKPYLVK